MANRRHTRADIKRIHTQTEINRRLNRASTLATYLPDCINRLPMDMPFFWIPSVMEYLADDLLELQQLIKTLEQTD